MPGVFNDNFYRTYQLILYIMVMPLIFNFGFWEIVIIALIVLLIFGGKKIPELMKGLGKGVKNFKEGMREVEDDVKEIKKDIEPEK